MKTDALIIVSSLLSCLCATFPAASQAQRAVEVVPNRGHTSALSEIAVTTDGRLFATTGNRDPIVRLWDPTSGRLMRAIRAGQEGTPNIAFSPDGRFLATSLEEVTLWETQSGAKWRTLHNGLDGDSKLDIFFANGGTWLIGFSYQLSKSVVSIFDVQSGGSVKVLQAVPSRIVSVALTIDAARLALISAGENVTDVELWNTEDWKVISRAKINGNLCRGGIKNIALTDGGKTLWCLDYNEIREIDLGQGGVRRSDRLSELEAYDNRLHTITKDGSVVWSVSSDGRRVAAWDPNLRKPITGSPSFSLHADACRRTNLETGAMELQALHNFAVSSKAEVAVLACYNEAYLWNERATDNPRGMRITDSLEDQNDLTISDDGSQAGILWKDGFVGVLDIAKADMSTRSLPTGTSCNRFRSSHNATRVIYTCADQSGAETIYIWKPGQSTVTSIPIAERDVSDATFHPFKLSPNGTLLAAQAASPEHQDDNALFSVAFSSDGTKLATVGTGRVNRFDLQEGRKLDPAIVSQPREKVAKKETRPPTEDVGDPWSLPPVARIWDAATGKEIRLLDSVSHLFRKIAFSPDNTMVAGFFVGRRAKYRAGDGRVTVWDASTGKVRWTKKLHNDGLSTALFSKDGSRLITTSLDGVVRELEAKTGRQIWSLSRKADDRWVIISAAAQSQNSQWLAFASGQITAQRGQPVDPTARVEVLQRQNKTAQCQIAGLTAQIVDLQFSSDGMLLIGKDRDEVMFMWRANTCELLAKLYTAEQGRWMLLTPKRFFASSDNALDMLSVVRGFDVYSVEQFRDQLERKDLVREQLAGDPLDLHAKQAENLNFEAVLASGMPPEINIVNRQIAGDSVRLSVRLFNNTTGGVGTKLKWRVNGVLQGNTEPNELKPPEARSGPVIVTQTLKLDPKQDNVITVTAYNGRDLLATRAYRIVVSRGEIFAPNERPPRLHIVAIGVNSYTGDRLPRLHLAVADANELADKLKLVASAGGYEVPDPIRLTEANATKERVIRAFDELAARNVSQQDALIVVLAGHGLSDGRCYYFVPYGANFGPGRTIKTEGIGCDLWEQLLGQVQAGKKALFIDTCESGSATTILRSVETLRQGTIERLSRSTGQAIFAAARDAAREDNQLGHGLLTFTVLGALAQAGAQGDVDVNSIKSYVEAQVPQLSERWYQQSQEATVKVFRNFPLGPPQSAAAPALGPLALPDRYILVASAQFGIGNVLVRSLPSPTASVELTLKAPREIQVFGFDPGGWALIGTGGKKMGWVPQENAVKQ